MTVENLAKQSGFKIICMPNPQKDVDGVYIGDLLSWVMGKAQAGNLWITIMSNINIVAVATLADTSCILLAEGVEPDGELVSVASAKGVNIIGTDKSAYEAAKTVSEIL